MSNARGTASAGQVLAFTAPATGTVYVAVSGRGDVPSYSLQAVTASPPPSALNGKCAHAVNGGALTVGAAATTGFAPDDHCVFTASPARAPRATP